MIQKCQGLNQEILNFRTNQYKRRGSDEGGITHTVQFMDGITDKNKDIAQ
jgi:hypothetical protein